MGDVQAGAHASARQAEKAGLVNDLQAFCNEAIALRPSMTEQGKTNSKRELGVSEGEVWGIALL